MHVKKYAILDSSNNDAVVGALFYDTCERKYSVKIEKGVDIDNLPLSLYIYAKKDIYELNDEYSFEWVRSRVCPSGRQNMPGILDEFGLEKYDEFPILEFTRGRCDKDGLYISM